MEQGIEYRQQVIEEYKQTVMPLLNYLPWFEQNGGRSAATIYGDQNIAEHSVTFPVYSGTLMNFVREATKTSLMEKNYAYVYTRNHIRNHDDERKLIAKADWRDWDLLRGILSKYVLGGRTKAVLWNEAVQEDIFYLVLKRMKEIIEFWDKPVEVE
ncbi:MAG: hypothetical protein E7291_10150 [Lachnospiraceae bacterium]|nr:hypothetical protein [Lachnospiraceae bacterium]